MSLGSAESRFRERVRSIQGSSGVNVREKLRVEEAGLGRKSVRLQCSSVKVLANSRETWKQRLPDRGIPDWIEMIRC